MTVLSLLALLVPAGGIAYLGAVSYRDQKGAVAAQIDRQRGAAVQIVARIDRAIGEALDAADRAATAGQTGPLAGLGRYWFWLDADGRMRVPRTAPATATVDPALDRPASPRGRIEDYVRELSRRQDRAGRLRAAQRAEASSQLAEARRGYTALVPFDDTGAEALLGLARVNSRLGDPARATALLDELDRRFADRSFPKGGTAAERVPVRLVTSLLRAEGAGDERPAKLLALAQAVLANHYPIDPIVGLGVVQRIRGELTGDLPQLDLEVETLRGQARAAAGLADDRDEVAHTAIETWRGRPAAKQPNRTLIYRRRVDGSVIGLAVDPAMLAAAAGHDAQDDVARNVRPIVLAAGATPSPELRTIQGTQVPLGQALPHLQVALVNPLTDPDPLDEVVRRRERTHIVFTSALALMLGVGLLAMIRGAARARELAQLKSDFVSTVSHELKTPLTSIRMFAEMLQQGVAQGDAEKMHRYHGVIVQESQRLGLLIANLLDYAQIERGTRRYTPSSVELAQLGRHAVSTFEALASPQAGRNPIHIDVSPAAMTTAVDVDRDVVVGAVLNLLANAAKYGGAEKPIEVAIDSDATSASIAVRDHGPGIPASEQARIFKEFYRTPEAYRSNVEGTGLGLALVKRHIEALGGTVEVASDVGKGATFTIRLPRGEHVA